MTPLGLAWLKLNEGCSLIAYPDPDSPMGRACAAADIDVRNWMSLPAAGHALDGSPWTIGYGCTGPSIGQHTEWTQDIADTQLLERVAWVEGQLGAGVAGWANIDPVRRDVLTNIAFNVGVQGLERWPITLSHFAAGKYAQAANDLLTEGPWDAEVGSRATLLSKVTLSGFWPRLPSP